MIRSPVAILALLTALNLLNYIDRFIVSAVLPAMSAWWGPYGPLISRAK